MIGTIEHDTRTPIPAGYWYPQGDVRTDGPFYWMTHLPGHNGPDTRVVILKDTTGGQSIMATNCPIDRATEIIDALRAHSR
jgi:hypothetical protein